MEPRRDIHRDPRYLSEGFDLTTYDRLYQALLLSTGHQKVDGKWQGADPFHVYREISTPSPSPPFQATGNLNFFFGPSFGQNEVRSITFRPAVVRNYSGISWEFDSESPVIEPDFSDFVLELNALGTSYIRRTRPDAPIANTGQFIGELRDVPQFPMRQLFREASSLRSLGSEYLNVEFGWKPFVNDLQKAYKLSKTINGKLQQLVRDNGLPIRRRRGKTTSVTTTVSEGDLTIDGTGAGWDLSDPTIGGDPSLSDYQILLWWPGINWASKGRVHYKKVVTSVDVERFSCIYRYFVPNIGSDAWTERAKSALFGADLTPSLAWELIPWSWLVDWFSNIGDLISNASEHLIDNLVMNDAFMALHRSEVTVLTAFLSWDEYLFESGLPSDSTYTYLHVPAGSAVASHTLIKENKLRQVANPYGFGLTFGGLTPRQLAILAALGISRGHRP